MKKKKDAALEYMLQLGIMPAKSASGAREQIRQVMDVDALTRLLEGDETDQDPGAFYRFKNQTLDAGLTFSGAFSGEILRKMCAEADAHPECFGDRILEAGCDCGILSCFLAKRFPEAQVTGLDRCPESIAAAKELAVRLKLTNVDFLAGTPETLSPGYDTVVSLRTMHENCAVEGEEALTPEEYEQACTEALKGYAEALTALLKPGGILFTAERSDPEELIRAWQAALVRAGAEFVPDSRKELACSEAGVPSPLTLLIAGKPGL